jgi:hypothetical protein
MTERWRKKLEGIDQVGPSDDVYERAKAGPTLTEAQSPMQRTSTRVATAIAAFVVFALAISLFAIPTLRLHEGSGALTAGGQLLPLWPARTTDEVQALQAQADSGDAAWALDPRQVATRFGQAVLGWPDAWAGGASSFDPTCGVVQGTYPNTASPEIPCAYAAGSTPVGGVGSAAPGTVCNSAFLLCGQATGSDPSTGPQSAFLSFAVAVCDPSSCHAAPTETVELFQPMRAGGGQIWAVIEASSPSIDLAVSPGQTVREGSSISTGARIRTGAQFGFGVHVGASGSCSLDKATDAYHGPVATDGLSTSAGSEIVTDFGPLSGTSCQQSEPGYVFAATGGKPIVRDGVAFDPLQPGGASLYALSAVPITFEWPAEAASSAPTPTMSTGWTTYTDPLGWTIDVPAGWVTRKVYSPTGGSNVNETGATFSSAAGTPGSSPAPGDVSLTLARGQAGSAHPTDDTLLPLAFGDLDHTDGGYRLDFQADGTPFTLTIADGAATLSSDQLGILQRMVSSISFQPWQGCQTRNGWASVCGLGGQTATAKQAGIAWMALSQDLHASGSWVGVYIYDGGNGTVLGPVDSCGEGEADTAELTPQAVWIALDCPDGSVQRWTKDGQPASTNTAPFDRPLEVHPVIKAWDGPTLLTNRDLTVG